MPPTEASICRASKAYNPSKSIVGHWYQQWRRSRYGTWEGSFDALSKKEASILAGGVLFRMTKFPFAAMVITPLMQRAHLLPSASDIAFVDSTTTCDSENHSITFMLTESCVGAIPLAVFITSDQKHESYVAAFRLLREAMQTISFGGQGYPRMFITDDAIAEKSALEIVWPNADRFNCIFHIAQAQWRWLWDGKNKIEKDDRKIFMNDFRKIMFSVTKSAASEAFIAAVSNARRMERSGYSLADYVVRLETLWERRPDWVIAFRSHHSRGNFTNNYAEITVRLFKENVLHRRKAYNAASLVEIICSDLESYYRNRLIEFANCRNNQAFLQLDSLYQRAAYVKSKDMIQLMADSVYLVPSEKGDQTYEVHTIMGYCTCKAGMFGQFCKHAAAVMKFYDHSFPNRPPVTYIDRHRIAVLALGKDAQPPQFYCAMNETMVEDSLESIAFMEAQHGDTDIAVEESPSVRPTANIGIDLAEAEKFTETLLADLENNKSNDRLAGAFRLFSEKYKLCKGQPSKLATLFSSASSSIPKKRREGAKIPFQHFAGSRRKGSSSKAKSGRVPVQKEHNLGKSVEQNRPNAKSHNSK